MRSLRRYVVDFYDLPHEGRAICQDNTCHCYDDGRAIYVYLSQKALWVESKPLLIDYYKSKNIRIG